MDTEKQYQNMQEMHKYERSAGYMAAQILKFILHYVVLMIKAALIIVLNVLRAFGLPVGR